MDGTQPSDTAQSHHTSVHPILVDVTQGLIQVSREETWDNSLSFNITANLSPGSGDLPSETASESISAAFHPCCNFPRPLSSQEDYGSLPMYLRWSELSIVQINLGTPHLPPAGAPHGSVGEGLNSTSGSMLTCSLPPLISHAPATVRISLDHPLWPMSPATCNSI